MTTSSSCFIRNATAADLPAIVECASSAFTRFEVFGPPWWSDAGVLPALLAGTPEGSPESGGLSRVACHPQTGAILGHAHWSVFTATIAGALRQAACLAPLSVSAQAQGMGVGSALMHDGIAALRARGIELLLILGHETYYPRFGLLTNCHGRHALDIPLPPPLAEDPSGWRLRPVRSDDAPVFLGLWQRLCAGADGAIHPGPGLLPWLSKTRDIVACTLEHNGVPVAHARFDARHGTTPESSILRFLAASPEAAGILAGRICGWLGWPATEGARLRIPLPPTQEAVKELFPGEIAPVYERWGAGMAMALADDGAGPVGALLEAVRAGDAPPLFVEWGAMFDF